MQRVFVVISFSCVQRSSEQKRDHQSQARAVQYTQSAYNEDAMQHNTHMVEQCLRIFTVITETRMLYNP